MVLLFLNSMWFSISIVHPTFDTGTLMFIFKKNGWLKGIHAMIQVFYLNSSDHWKILISLLLKIDLVSQMVKSLEQDDKSLRDAASCIVDIITINQG
ncbi:hypothetical protein QQP08_023265 [Theobroma cacao]|nr:hypothetical protein QQP08_023265 [Theobroma cacao]